MDFTHRKLPADAADNMRLCPIETIAPYALMIGPAYVFMKMNEKFVSVKAPMDFFTPEELEKKKAFQAFYFPKFIDVSATYRDQGRRVRELITLEAPIELPPTPVPGTEDAEDAPNDAMAAINADGPRRLTGLSLPPAPYEISNSVIRALGKLWGKDMVIEPFFVAVFVNEVCDLLPADAMVAARDQDISVFEAAVMRSAWAVFMALHLGACDLSFLNALRLAEFKRVVAGEPAIADSSSELREIQRFASLTLDGNAGVQGAPGFDNVLIAAECVLRQGGRLPEKLAARLQRIRTQLLDATKPIPTIHGPEGFVDV